MEILVKAEHLAQISCDTLELGIYDEENSQNKEFDKLLSGILSQLREEKVFTGGLKQHFLLTSCGSFQCKRILLTGLGKQEKMNHNLLRKIAAASARYLRSLNISTYTTSLASLAKINNDTAASAVDVTEGIILGTYAFNKYVTKRENIKQIKQVTLLFDKNIDLSPLSSAVKEAARLSELVCYVRDLTNEPAATVTPAYLAEEAKKIKEQFPDHVKLTLYHGKEIEEKGMGGLYSVSKGSALEPYFIVLEYLPAAKDQIIFVGKGITFDSGGLDIKNAQGMDTMRSDMAGAATVLATLRAVCELQLKQSIVAIIPTCENMTGERAFRPGDILYAYNGKTMEINNTDAEGRLILADGLSYAEKHFKPKAIIDIATLTGASIYALGYEITSLVSTDEMLKKKVLGAGKAVDEYVWELPMIDEYKDLMKSEIADVRNLSKESMGPGVITGAVFLSNFVEHTPWVHLDIGASSWVPSERGYKTQGATGICLRTFIYLLKHWDAL